MVHAVFGGAKRRRKPLIENGTSVKSFLKKNISTGWGHSPQPVEMFFYVVYSALIFT
jgi:hypothetical protein